MSAFRPGLRGLAAWCARIGRSEGAIPALKFFAACCCSFLAARQRLVCLEADLESLPREEFRPGLPVLIRTAVPADYPRLRRFPGPPVIEGRLERGDVCVLAELDGRIVCGSWFTAGEDYLFALKKRVFPEAGAAYHTALYTLPACRGRGIGRAVEGALLAEAKKRGHRKVTEYISASNGVSLDLTKKVGFRPVKEISYFRALWYERSAETDLRGAR